MNQPSNVTQATNGGRESDTAPNFNSDYCTPSQVNALGSPGPNSVTTQTYNGITPVRPQYKKQIVNTAVAWGNGTGRTGGRNHRALHEFWASHGIIVAVSHSGATASGGPIVSAMDLLDQLKRDSSSPFAGKISDKYIVSGQSQGGIELLLQPETQE